MRTVLACLGLAFVISIGETSGALAGPATYGDTTIRGATSTRVSTNRSPQTRSYSPKAPAQVPPNCIMQSCGTLYCWQMKH